MWSTGIRKKRTTRGLPTPEQKNDLEKSIRPHVDPEAGDQRERNRKIRKSNNGKEIPNQCQTGEIAK
jgi:hypothetical protein